MVHWLHSSPVVYSLALCAIEDEGQMLLPQRDLSSFMGMWTLARVSLFVWSDHICACKHRFDAVVYQTSLTLLIYATSLFLASFKLHGASILTGNVEPRIDVGAILFFVLTGLSFLDLWITPIPFRIMYFIFPVIISTLTAVFTGKFLSTWQSNVSLVLTEHENSRLSFSSKLISQGCLSCAKPAFYWNWNHSSTLCSLYLPLYTSWSSSQRSQGPIGVNGKLPIFSCWWFWLLEYVQQFTVSLWYKIHSKMTAQLRSAMPKWITAFLELKLFSCRRWSLEDSIAAGETSA